MSPTSLPTEPLVEYIERLYPDCHNLDNHAKDRFHGSVLKALAELTGLSQRTVARVVCREHDRASIDTIDKICIALGTHPVALYGRLWTHKTCRVCGEELPVSEFGCDAGLTSNTCYRCASRKRRQKVRAKLTEMKDRHGGRRV